MTMTPTNQTSCKDESNTAGDSSTHVSYTHTTPDSITASPATESNLCFDYEEEMDNSSHLSRANATDRGGARLESALASRTMCVSPNVTNVFALDDALVQWPAKKQTASRSFSACCTMTPPTGIDREREPDDRERSKNRSVDKVIPTSSIERDISYPDEELIAITHNVLPSFHKCSPLCDGANVSQCKHITGCKYGTCRSV